MHSSDNLKILYWNANGITTKSAEFFDYLLSENIKVAAICETFLKPQIRFSHPDFSIHRPDTTNGIKDGVAIAISNEICHKVISLPKLKIIEAIGISILTSLGSLIIISIFHPGSNKDCISFKQDIRALCNIRDSFIICGDFNSRHQLWNCARSNRMGKSLFETVQRDHFSIFHPDTHTFYPSDSARSPSTLDLVLSNNLHDISSLKTITNFDSDHLPVCFEVQFGFRKGIPTTDQLTN